MSCVHYKFKNSLDYETLTFDGLYISVEELKRAIYEKKRIGKSTDCDLKITNAQTKEVYDEDKNLIPRNSSVIVARVPAASLQKLPKVHDTRNEGTVNKAKLFGGNSNAGPSSELPEKSNLASNDTLSEEDKIQRVLYDSSKDYLPGSYQKPNRSLMTGAPPPTYVCHKCDQGGHWITNCPNPRKVRGIPRDELVETTQDDPRAMMTTSGTYVAQKLHQEAYANPKKDKPPVWDDEETVEVAQPIPTALVPKDMLCSLCKDLFIDAVIIPCCGTSFCDSCIRTELLESESHQCPYCHSERQSPDSLVPNKFLRQAVTRFRNENATYSAKAKPSHQETLKLSLVRPKPKSPDVIIVESSLRAHNAGVGASSFLNDPDITEVEPTVKREPTQTTTDGQSKPPPERVLMPPGTTLASEMPPVPMGTFSIPVAAVAPSMVVGAAVMPPGVPIHPVYPTAQPPPPGVSQCAAALPDVKPPGLGQPLAPGVAAGPAGSRPLTVEEFYDKKQKLWESHKIDPLEEFQKFQEYRKKRDRTPASRSTSRSSDSGSASRSRSRSRSPRVGRKREDSRRVRPRRRSRSPSRSKSPVRRGRPRSRSTSRGRYRSRSRSTSRRRRRQRSFSRSRSRSRGRLPPAAGRMLPYDFFTQAMLQPMPPHQGGYNPASQFLQPPGSAYSTGFPPSVPPPQQAMGLSYPPRNVGPQMMGGIYGASANIPHFAGPLMQLPPPTNLDLSRFNQSRFYRPQRGTDVSRWQSSRPSSSRYDPKSSYRHRSPRRRDSSPTDRRDEERRRDRSPAEQKSDEKTGDSRRRKELREERGEKSSRRRSGSPSRGEEAKTESTAKTEEKVVKEKLERKKSKDDKEKERKRSNSPSVRDKNPKTADDKTLSDEKAKVDDKPFLNEEKSKSDEKAKPSSAKLTKSDDRGETSKTRADHKRKRQRRTEDEKTDRADEKKETIVSPNKKELKHVVEKTEILATSVVESPVKGVKTEEAEVPVVERVKTDEEKSKPAETAVVAKEEPMEEAKSKHKRKRSYREEKSSKEALKATDSGEKEEKKSRRASKQEDSEADESGAKKSSDEKKHKKHRKKSEKKKKHRHHRKRRSTSTEPSA